MVYDDPQTDAEDFIPTEAGLFGDEPLQEAGGEGGGQPSAAPPEDLMMVPDILVEGQDEVVAPDAQPAVNYRSMTETALRAEAVTTLHLTTHFPHNQGLEKEKQWFQVSIL